MGPVNTDASYFQGRRTAIMLISHDLFLLFRLVIYLPDRRFHRTSQLKLKISCVKPLKSIMKHGPRRWNYYSIRGLS